MGTYIIEAQNSTEIFFDAEIRTYNNEGYTGTSLAPNQIHTHTHTHTYTHTKHLHLHPIPNSHAQFT